MISFQFSIEFQSHLYSSEVYNKVPQIRVFDAKRTKHFIANEPLMNSFKVSVDFRIQP